MSTEANKDLTLRWIRAFNERDSVTEAACRTADYRAHVSGMPGPLDADAWTEFLATFTAAFPDAQLVPECSIAEGDIVAIRWTITGTHRGDFLGVPATGRRVTMQGIEFSRLVDGRCAEHWSQFDVIGVMQQIGAMPAPA